MWFNININVVHKLGYAEAIFLEHLDNKNPANNIIRLNVSNVCKDYKITLSTGQRAIKTLTTEEYIVKHSSNTYTLGEKFYSTFPEYYHKKHTYGKYNSI